LGSIDPNDDTLHRFIVWHYHYVEEFRERKLEAICAYSTMAEAGRDYSARSADLLKRQVEGLTDGKEYFSCGYRRPGYKEHTEHQRLEIKKMRSGWIAQRLTKNQTSGKSDAESSQP